MIITLSPDEAATKLRAAGIRTSPSKIRAGIIQRVYPFGEAVKMKNYEFTIYEKQLDKYIEERKEHEIT